MKFLALCPCEKVIIDQRGAHSLITIMENVEVSTQPSATSQPVMPTNAVMPKEWFVYTRWLPSEEDIGKTFRQTYQLYWPNGEKFTEGYAEFKATESFQQNVLQLQGMPVGQPGKVKVAVWVEHDGRRVTEVIETHFKVKHTFQPDISSEQRETTLK
jgi:hypothetical protein